MQLCFAKQQRRKNQREWDLCRLILFAALIHYDKFKDTALLLNSQTWKVWCVKQGKGLNFGKVEEQIEPRMTTFPRHRATKLFPKRASLGLASAEVERLIHSATLKIQVPHLRHRDFRLQTPNLWLHRGSWVLLFTLELPGQLLWQQIFLEVHQQWGDGAVSEPHRGS